MLVEAAIGDAYGLAFEAWATPQLIAEHNNLQYQMIDDPKNKHYGAIKKGHYTDDTQMMIELAEALLENDPWTAESIATRFVRGFHRDKRKGYAGGFYGLLMECHTGQQLLARIRPDSDKSGAVMRAPVLGYIPGLRELNDKCLVQSKITHNTQGGSISAFMGASMAHYFIYDLGPKKELDLWMEEEAGLTNPEWLAAWPGGRVSSEGMNCVRAAKTAILTEDTLSGVLKHSVSWGGDTDTIACIAMACASVCKEIKNDLPKHLYDGLENKAYGRDYLTELDQKLEAKFR